MAMLPSPESTRHTRWLVFTLAVMVTAALAGLGLWQLDRAGQKETMVERMNQRTEAPARAVARLAQLDDPAHYPVEDRGHFDNTRSVLIDNRIRDGRAGYHLLTLFHTRSGARVLVNRGWLPRGPDRQTLPEIPEVKGEVRIRGHAHVHREKNLVLREDRLDQQDWPLRVQRVDRAALQQRLGVELAPFIVRLAPETGPERGAQLPREWPERQMGPQRHYAYAVQWFAMAALAPVLFWLAGRRRPDQQEGP
jgi:surfeit locus 1 family protein